MTSNTYRCWWVNVRDSRSLLTHAHWRRGDSRAKLLCQLCWLRDARSPSAVGVSPSRRDGDDDALWAVYSRALSKERSSSRRSNEASLIKGFWSFGRFDSSSFLGAQSCTTDFLSSCKRKTDQFKGVSYRGRLWPPASLAQTNPRVITHTHGRMLAAAAHGKRRLFLSVCKVSWRCAQAAACSSGSSVGKGKDRQAQCDHCAQY